MERKEREATLHTCSPGSGSELLESKRERTKRSEEKNIRGQAGQVIRSGERLQQQDVVLVLKRRERRLACRYASARKPCHALPRGDCEGWTSEARIAHRAPEVLTGGQVESLNFSQRVPKGLVTEDVELVTELLVRENRLGRRQRGGAGAVEDRRRRQCHDSSQA